LATITFQQQKKSNHWKIFFLFFSDGHCNFSGHNRTLQPPQNMPVITPKNKNSHPSSNYNSPFFFFFLMAAAPRWPPYTNHHKQRWQPQNRPANIRKHEQNHFFFSPIGVLVTIKQEQNSSTEFFEGIVLRAVLPPIRKSPTTQESKQALILCYSL
jgi:hypothetical protein